MYYQPFPSAWCVLIFRKKKIILSDCDPFSLLAVSDDGDSTFFGNVNANLPNRTVSYPVFFNLHVVGLRLTSFFSFCCVQLVVRCRGPTVFFSISIKLKGFTSSELILICSRTNHWQGNKKITPYMTRFSLRRRCVLC